MPTFTGIVPHFTASVPHFKLTFILGTTNTITLTDLLQNYTAYGTTVKAVFQITDPDGLLFFQNVGFASAPPSFTSPDFDSGSGTWAVTGITPYLDVTGTTIKRGTYTVTAWYECDSGTPVEIVKEYYLDYVSPTVIIDMASSCRTSELIVTDSTDYLSIGESVPLSSTLSRSCAVTQPAGSGANAPATTTSTTLTYTRTIGGGSTSATRLWTRIWQTNIVTSLVFEMEAWDSYTWIVIQDTVYGDDFLDVQCSDCACTLNTCWENLITRWKDAEANHAVNVGDLRYKVALGSALWTEFYNMERCGEDTTYKCIEIKTLLDSVDCSCTTNPDTQSKVIVPWGASLSGGSASSFHFRFSTTDPAEGTGSDEDVTFQSTSKHLWYKSGSSWLDKGSLSGSDGAVGANAVPEIIFSNTTPNVGTSAGTSLEKLGYVDLSSPVAYGTGDEIYAKLVYELASNDNGKEVSLYINATKITSHFTDTMVNATNNTVTIEMWMNITGTNTQSIETMITRGGNSYPAYTTGTFVTGSGIAINAYGQNTVATLNDIILRVLKVKYNKAIQLT